MHPVSSRFFGPSGIVCLFTDQNGTEHSGYIVKQLSANRFIVSNGSVTGVARLAQTTQDATSLPPEHLTISIRLPDNTVEHVSRLEAKRCMTTSGNNVKWALGTSKDNGGVITASDGGGGGASGTIHLDFGDPVINNVDYEEIHWTETDVPGTGTICSILDAVPSPILVTTQDNDGGIMLPTLNTASGETGYGVLDGSGITSLTTEFNVAVINTNYAITGIQPSAIFATTGSSATIVGTAKDTITNNTIGTWSFDVPDTSVCYFGSSYASVNVVSTLTIDTTASAQSCTVSGVGFSVVIEQTVELPQGMTTFIPNPYSGSAYTGVFALSNNGGNCILRNGAVGLSFVGSTSNAPTALPFIPNYYAIPQTFSVNGYNGDLSVLGGSYPSSNDVALLDPATGNITNLGTIPGTLYQSIVGMTSDGNALFGGYADADLNFWVWKATASTGLVTFSSYTNNFYPYHMSADGSRLGGVVMTNGNPAVLMTVATGALTNISGWGINILLSEDGNVAVSWSQDGDNNYLVYYWSVATGSIQLGSFSGNPNASGTFGNNANFSAVLSGDGSTIAIWDTINSYIYTDPHNDPAIVGGKKLYVMSFDGSVIGAQTGSAGGGNFVYNKQGTLIHTLTSQIEGDAISIDRISRDGSTIGGHSGLSGSCIWTVAELP